MTKLQLKDLRKMGMNEVISCFNQAEVVKKLENYMMTFDSLLGTKTISELCETYDLSETSVESLKVISQRLETSKFAGLLQDNILRYIPIKGHYEIDGTHIFPFMLDEVKFCGNCPKAYYSFGCIYISASNSFGVLPFPLADEYKFIKDDIRTFLDVWKFVNSKVDLTQHPLLY